MMIVIGLAIVALVLSFIFDLFFEPTDENRD
jgi:multisubunit Na+/H+ antiporter MnhC subunit